MTPHLMLRNVIHMKEAEPIRGLLEEISNMTLWEEDRLLHDVEDFHMCFGHPAPTEVETPADATLDFRIKLIREECEELCEAIQERNLARIAAEAVDLIYVVVGTLVVCGLPLMPFWRNVQRANMTKVVNPTGGKPLKPDSWLPPNPEGILEDLGFSYTCACGETTAAPRPDPYEQEINNRVVMRPICDVCFQRSCDEI